MEPEKIVQKFDLVAGLVAQAEPELGTKRLENLYHVECVREGKVIWTEDFKNLVVDEGLNDSLDKHLKGAGFTAAWYIGLINNAPAPSLVAGDTLASHAGWVETTAYDEWAAGRTGRATLTLGSVAAKSVDNSASKGVFTINGTVTVYGAFVCNQLTGTTGVLYGEGAFSQTRAVIDNDVINVTVTCTAAAS